MAARKGVGRGDAPPKALVAVAIVAVVAGPAYAILARDVGTGALVFAAGLVLLGVGMLLGGRDRKAGWVLIGIGTLTAAVDVLRLLLVGPW